MRSGVAWLAWLACSMRGVLGCKKRKKDFGKKMICDRRPFDVAFINCWISLLGKEFNDTLAHEWQGGWDITWEQTRVHKWAAAGVAGVQDGSLGVQGVSRGCRSWCCVTWTRPDVHWVSFNAHVPMYYLLPFREAGINLRLKSRTKKKQCGCACVWAGGRWAAGPVEDPASALLVRNSH